MSKNTAFIKFLNLFGVPLNYLNTGSQDSKYEYLIIENITNDKIIVNVNYPAVIDPNYSFYQYDQINNLDFDVNNLIGSNFGGGNQIYVRKINEILKGYPYPNNYVINFEKL